MLSTPINKINVFNNMIFDMTTCYIKFQRVVISIYASDCLIDVIKKRGRRSFMDRNSGIIMHIASLPGKYGIGTFGKEAYKFADFLKKSGQKYWQILPLGPTSFGDSPYQSFSAFAGNPYFIDFDILKEKGFLKAEEYEKINFGENDEEIDYALIFNEKMKVLRKAFDNFNYNKNIEVSNKFELFKN